MQNFGGETLWKVATCMTKMKMTESHGGSKVNTCKDGR